jgi:hypothetical protein
MCCVASEGSEFYLGRLKAVGLLLHIAGAVQILTV